MIIYIYGPRGCGKTSNTKRFEAYYGIPVWEEAHFFDDKTKDLSNAVILGHGDSMPDQVVIDMLKMRVISFEEAMKESESS